MESAAISAASWVVSKALSPLSDGLLEKWAATSELSSNVRDLNAALLHAQSVLNIAQRRRDDRLKLNIAHDSQAALAELRRLADDAEDTLDELDYFRIQDEVEGTDEAADAADAARGCLHGLAFNPRHTAKAVVKRLACSSSCGGRPQQHDDDEEEEPPAHQPSDDMLGSRRILCPGKWLRRAPRGAHANQLATTKLEFDRVDLSKRMKQVTEQLEPLCQKVSKILKLEFLASECATTVTIPGINRPVTTSQMIESKLYGRDNEMANIIRDITQDGRYCGEQLTVLPIVGPGGIGKTTLTQSVYCSKQAQSHFDVKIWVCVSRNFNVHRLTEEIYGCVTKKKEPNQNLDHLQKQLEEALQHKRFLVVLDDMWDDMWKCGGEDEWKRLLLPLRKGQQGSIVLVTTRIPEIADMVKLKKTVHSVQLEGIEPKEFWDLFKQYAFDDDQESKEDPAGLFNIGQRIVEKLKGSPLAAKTVGSLLRKHTTPEHWTRVLDSELWKSHTDGIMPALRLSYDYLPFHLQQCFSYCALFPDDHKFRSDELIYLWIGIGILHSSDSSHDQNSRPEEIGSTYLDELVAYGFFKREKTDGHLCYVVHDLLNDLARLVSKQECLSIDPSTARHIKIQPSIRHLSIIMSHADSKDVMTEENFRKDLSRLSNLKSENLHSLILLGDYDERFTSIFGDLFGDTKALRVLLSSLSCSLESILKHFPKLVHLRYLRLTAKYGSNMQLPKTLSRFYHLKILDLKGWHWDVPLTLPGDMSNLVKLRHFLVWNDDHHSNISDVGKLQFLQELRKFKVKKENNCFKLCQLGQLGQLGGSISIYNLENVQEEEEADAAKLWRKDRLRKLTLAWHTDDPHKEPEKEGKVLERLQPHDNIRELCIIGNGGPACPPWLGSSLSVKTLESLSLVGVDWKLLPPLGDLFQLNEINKEYPCCVRGQMFMNLKRIELVGLPRLRKWVGKVDCHLFALLEVLIVRDCCELVELPFSQYACCPAENDVCIDWFPKLQKVVINGCPKLPLPPVPWSRTLCDVQVSIKKREGSDVYLSYSKYPEYSSLGECLRVDGGNDLIRNLDEVLAFHNLIDLKQLDVSKCPPLAVEQLKMLSALKILHLDSMSNVLAQLEGCRDISQLPVKSLLVINCGASGKELTQLLNHFPELLDLRVDKCPQITRLVVEQQSSTTLTAPSCYSSDNGGEEEDEGLLLLPPHLSNSLTFMDDPELRLVVSPHFGKNPKARGTYMHVGGLRALCSLQSLDIWDCPKFLSGVGSSSQWLFPSSLKYLVLTNVEGMKTLEPISNLTSLTELVIQGCGEELTGEGLQALLTQGGHLTRLRVQRCPQVFGSWESWMKEECLSCSTMLQQLETDDFAGVLVEPVCRFLSSSLCELALRANYTVEHLTRGQEEALNLLTSLQELKFEFCFKLQFLPAGLRALANLKRLEISNCPAVRSLRKDDLPSSLHILDVSLCNSNELKQHCRKMKGIPKMCI